MTKHVTRYERIRYPKLRPTTSRNFYNGSKQDTPTRFQFQTKVIHERKKTRINLQNTTTVYIDTNNKPNYYHIHTLISHLYFILSSVFVTNKRTY